MAFGLCNGSGLTILSPPALEGEYESAPLSFPSFDFDVTATVFYESSLDICNQASLDKFASQMEDKIILYQMIASSTRK